jgi:small redox-active disulfide protein 2
VFDIRNYVLKLDIINFIRKKIIMVIKILGSGCSKCVNLENKVKEIVKNNNIDATVEKVSELQDIMKYGIMSTPGLVINEKVISYGTVPKDSQILEWLKEAN